MDKQHVNFMKYSNDFSMIDAHMCRDGGQCAFRNSTWSMNFEKGASTRFRAEIHWSALLLTKHSVEHSKGSKKRECIGAVATVTLHACLPPTSSIDLTEYSFSKKYRG